VQSPTNDCLALLSRPTWRGSRGRTDGTFQPNLLSPRFHRPRNTVLNDTFSCPYCLCFSLVLLTAVRSTLVCTHSKHQRYFFMPLLPLFFRSCSMLPSLQSTISQLISRTMLNATFCFSLVFLTAVLSTLDDLATRFHPLPLFFRLSCSLPLSTIYLLSLRCTLSTPCFNDTSLLPFCFPCLPSTISQLVSTHPVSTMLNDTFSCPCLALPSLHSFSPTPNTP
jgi:hypothetical protein